MKDRLTPEDIDALIEDVEYLKTGTLTVCVLRLTNGCMVTGQSNVINPANYRGELGEKAAYEQAKGKIWELEGYALKRELTAQM